MNILHKSSSFETYIYYFIYPVLICVCAYFAVKIISFGSFSLFTIIFLLFFIAFFIFSFDSLIRLRFIEVTEDGILIKKISGKKTIEFKDVEYVYNLMNINGTSLIIKYKDPQTGKSKVILTRPEEKAPSPREGFPVYNYGSLELNVTQFIKEKATKANPNYSYESTPRWFLLGLN